MAAGPSNPRWLSGSLFLIILLVAAALVFALVWVLVSPNGNEFNALLGIGFLALLFGLVAYLTESVLRDPAIGRAVSYGFSTMGFVIVFLTVGLLPSATTTTTDRLLLALLTVLMLAVAVLGYYWRSGALPQEAARLESRTAWQRTPVASAFEYSGARNPAVPPPPDPSDPPAGRS